MSNSANIVQKETRIICGALCNSSSCTSSEINLRNYSDGAITKNVTTRFDKFLETPQDLSDRIIDLLEIAAYVFCADRCIHRGNRSSLNNHSWGRTQHFMIPVQDSVFWNSIEVKEALVAALTFMTGDRNYVFDFVQASVNPLKEEPYQTSLFSTIDNYTTISDDIDVMLFSGGLDSLAGAIERLNLYPDRKLFLINHMSNNRSIKAQKVLVDQLKHRYTNRVIPYTFECRFCKLKSRDETQRTRMFLFSAIAYAICSQYSKHSFYVYENGITSINLPKEADLINARASRTTHPKTIGLLQKFYKCFDVDFSIDTPYRMLTKEDVVRKFIEYGEESLIQLSVSCSSTRNVHEIAPHCGCCSQCIDRRFAMYATGLADDYDSTSFATSMAYDKLDSEASQRVSGTLLFASKGIGNTKMDFLKKYPTELIDVISYWHNTPDESLDDIYRLFQRYSDSVRRAAIAMEASFDDIPTSSNSLISKVSEKNRYDLRENERFELCIKNSVFVLANTDETRQGSCFYLEDYGLVTSHHVTNDGDFYNVCIYDAYPQSCGIVSRETNEICSCEIIDYALYNLLHDCSHYFRIGNSKSLAVGNSVKIIGYPNFQRGTTYDLAMTEIRRKTIFLQTPLYVVNSTVFHGTSGGVVLNSYNEIVGLVRAGVESIEEEQSSSIQGFVPIHLILEDIEKQGH